MARGNEIGDVHVNFYKVDMSCVCVGYMRHARRSLSCQYVGHAITGLLCSHSAVRFRGTDSGDIFAIESLCAWCVLLRVSFTVKWAVVRGLDRRQCSLVVLKAVVLLRLERK